MSEYWQQDTYSDDGRSNNDDWLKDEELMRLAKEALEIDSKDREALKKAYGAYYKRLQTLRPGYSESYSFKTDDYRYEMGTIGQCTWWAWNDAGDERGIFPTYRPETGSGPIGNGKSFLEQVNDKDDYWNGIEIDKFDGQYQKGDIIVYGSENGYGHVAIVDGKETINGKEYLVLSQCNLRNDRLYSRDYYDVQNHVFYEHDPNGNTIRPVELDYSIGEPIGVLRFNSEKYERDLDTRAGEMYKRFDREDAVFLSELEEANGVEVYCSNSIGREEMVEILRYQGQITKKEPYNLNPPFNRSMEIVIGNTQNKTDWNFEEQQNVVQDALTMQFGKCESEYDKYISDGEAVCYFKDGEGIVTEVRMYSPERYKELTHDDRMNRPSTLEARDEQRIGFEYTSAVRTYNPNEVIERNLKEEGKVNDTSFVDIQSKDDIERLFDPVYADKITSIMNDPGRDKTSAEELQLELERQLTERGRISLK